MTKLKKVATLLVLAVLNFYAAKEAFYHYDSIVGTIINRTVNADSIASGIFWLLTIAGIFLFLMVPKFRPVSLALLSWLIVGISFLVFSINRHFAELGHYYCYPVHSAYDTDEGSFIWIQTDSEIKPTKVEAELALAVDSANLRVDKGFFGLRYYTNEVKITAKRQCLPRPIDSTRLAISLYEEAEHLKNLRCFDAALNFYSKVIELDTLLVPEAYYGRGRILLFQHNYKAASADFSEAILNLQKGLSTNEDLQYNSQDQIAVDTLRHLIASKNFKTLLQKFKHLSDREELRKNAWLLEYCEARMRDVRPIHE